MKNAKVTISRPTYSDGSELIHIEIIDESSRLHVIGLDLTYPNFVRCLTGQGFIPATVDHWCGKNAKDIGKQSEHKNVILKGRCPIFATREEKEAWVLKHPGLKPALKGGWELWDDGTTSQQPDPNNHHIHLVRYV